MTELRRRVLHYLPVKALKPNPKNPRKHSRSQILALAECMKALGGLNSPMLVDRDGQIIAGHGRWEAAKLNGYEDVPVIRLDDLTESQARALMVADNKLADLSSFDEQLLAPLMKELAELSLEFDLEVTGFTTPEIDLLIQSLHEDDPDSSADEFTVCQGPVVSRLGDHWTLGEHVVVCGSALDPASYSDIGDKRISAVFTDPPWNVPIKGHVSGLGKIKHREFLQGSGEMTAEEFAAFLEKALGLAKAQCRDGAILFVAMDWRRLREILDAARAHGLQMINLCFWLKTNAGMGSLYRSQHELIFVFRNGSKPHRNNVELGRHGRNRTNVWTYPSANRPAGRKERALDYHPTPKPIRLVADALLDCTARGDYVMDPFLGSGTTILAAEKTGRKAFGIELDPVYVDTVISRWQKLTGQQAYHQDGRSFAQIQAERAGS